MLQHVLLMVVLEDHSHEVVVLDVLLSHLDPVCVCTLISVEIKMWTIDFEESHCWCGLSSSVTGFIKCNHD